MTQLLFIVSTLAVLAGANVGQRPAAGSAPLLDRINGLLASGAPDFIALRHDLHQHPELSGGEERTARAVADRLRALGLEVRTAIGGHGVVALLKGSRPGPLVAFRADMDAVPSNDADPVDYRSVTPGVRHQCGHDVHTSVGVALATGLAGVRADLPGSIMFIFQPAEERATGARAMLAAGVFARERPVAIYGLHTAPYEVGQIATRPGVMMASRDGVSVTISGTGDLPAAAAAARSVVAGVSTITQAQVFQPIPEGFAFAQVGPATPVGATMTIRGVISLAGAAARDRVKQAIAQGLAAIVLPGVTVTHEYETKLVAGVTNDAALTAAAVTSLTTALGAPAVQTVQGIPPAFSEDFGSFQDEVPGVFFYLGVSNASKGYVGMPHTPAYVADDDAIVVGARAMAAVLLERLGRPTVRTAERSP